MSAIKINSKNEQSTTSCIKFYQHGGPDVLKFEECSITNPKSTEVLIRHCAIGVNFIDSYYRTGLYPITFPSGLGTEAAGVVEAVGKDVPGLKVGDRVAYATGPLGSYAERRLVESRHVVKIPDGVSFEKAASVLLKGLTVHYLFKNIFPLEKGQQILFHAAAGGVGLIACQWASHLGVQLIGTVSSKEKAEIAKKHGAWEVINYVTENVPEQVIKLTNGKKVPVVFDSIGKSTWETSLDCLRSKGLMVSFGNASGPVTGVNLATLAQKGSLTVTRPILSHYMETNEDLSFASKELFSLVKAGKINIETPIMIPLKDAIKAHSELANRQRTGAIVLIP